MTALPVKAVLIGLLSVSLFGFLYTPVPERLPASDQWLLRRLYIFHQLGELAADFGHIIGYGSRTNNIRSLREYFTPPSNGASDVQQELRSFDEVSVIVYNKSSWRPVEHAAGAKLRPAIYYIHGGGWTYGHIEAHANLERRLVDELNVLLVSVHYRLAPEHPYPEPLDDCLTALRYFHSHSIEFGIDPSRITVVGDSSGANLAAAVTLKLRDAGEPFLHHQVLISPITHISTCVSNASIDNAKYSTIDPSYYLRYMNASLTYRGVFNVNGHVSERIRQHKAWPYIDKYHTSPLANVMLNEEAAQALEEKLMNPYICPMMADSLAGLPPALVLASEYDVLRDDALAYADRLQAEGTQTTVIRSESFHGAYGFFAESETGEAIVKSVIDYLRPVVGSVDFR